MREAVAEVADLLQHLIRNACVNDGTPGSGGESRNADLLASYLEGHGLDLERYEPAPERASLVARLEGRRPGGPSLLLMGHTDVVPANPERWRHDPFGGELIDGEIWGRGAVDMLCQTASMAVAVRRLADEGFRPSGPLIYLAVADEEAGGTHGARWLTENVPEVVRCRYLITESGGYRVAPSSAGVPVLPVTVGEKGVYWCTVRVRGTPGHGSMPLGSDNALVKAAEVVHRLAEYRPRAQIPDVWRRFVEGAELPPALATGFVDPDRIDEVCASNLHLGLARVAHACTHTTLTPTVLRAGVKVNVIPDGADLQVDIRSLPGQTGRDIHAMLRDALGDLLDDSTEIVVATDEPASSSPFETPLWESLGRVASGLVPGARTVPSMMAGVTDARFFRQLGTIAYGFGLFSERVSLPDYLSRIHGDDERIDIDSLRLSVELWTAVTRDLLG